jgi:hypothetical protein
VELSDLPTGTERLKGRQERGRISTIEFKRTITPSGFRIADPNGFSAVCQKKAAIMDGALNLF